MGLKMMDVADVDVASLAETCREGHECWFRDLGSLISDEESDVLEGTTEKSVLTRGLGVLRWLDTLLQAAA